MVCEISTLESIADFLVWPTTCDYHFYLKILGAIMLVGAWVLFKSEEARTGTGNLISALGVSSIAVSVLAIIGTLISNSDGIPMIQLDILMYILATTIVLVLIWMFKD